MNEAAAENGLELVDWTSVNVYNEVVEGSILVIEGVTVVPMHVALYPEPAGVVPYQYWPIKVCGKRYEVSPQVETPYRLTRQLQDLPPGEVGIELIGATMRKRIPPEQG